MSNTVPRSRQPDRDAVDRRLMAERDRIVSELTNRLVNRMFAVGLTLQRAQQRAVNPEVRDLVAAAVADLDKAISDIRRIVFETPAGDNDVSEKRQQP